MGFLTVQSIYFNLDFSQVAQQDWQGPLVAVVGLLTLQAWPGAVGRLASALALAVALAIRPQVVLLLPAFISALDEAARPPGRPPSRTVFAAIGWGLALLVFLGLAFAPLARAGVLDDFVQGVRLVGYGAEPQSVDDPGALGEFLGQLGSVSLWAVPASIACLVGSARPPARRRAVTWGLALLGVLFYLPLSPVTRPYLILPLMLVWSVNVAVLVGLVLEARPASPPLQLAAVVLILLGLKATSWPRFCAPLASLRALSAPMRDVGPERAPEGYVHPYGPMVPLYPWQDYRATLRELRRNTSPETRVANALMGVALTGPAARLPAFPAESATWLFVVRPEAEAEFARALEEAPDSVVVWGARRAGSHLDPSIRAPGVAHPEALRAAGPLRFPRNLAEAAHPALKGIPGRPSLRRLPAGMTPPACLAPASRAG